MISYYVRETFGYIPLLMVWIALLYIGALMKEPEIVADWMGEDHPWRRKISTGLVFISFFVPLMGGFGQMITDSSPMRYFHEVFRYFLIYMPVLFCSGLSAAMMVGLGWDVAERVEKRRREERCR